MPQVRVNKLIPIIAVIGLVIVAAVFMNGKDAPQHVPLVDVPKPADLPDGDTPQDTLRALTAEVKTVKSETKEVLDENRRLHQLNDELNRNRVAIEDNVTRKLAERFSRPDASGSPVVQGLDARLNQLEAIIGKYGGGASDPQIAGATDIPGGLGFEGVSTANIPEAAAGPLGITAGGQHPAPTTGAIVWIEPLGQKMVMGSNNQPQLVKTALAPQTRPGGVASPAVNGAPMAAPMPGDAAHSALAVPVNPSVTGTPNKKAYFTIPENSVLMDSTAMTALIGRTPVNGNVRDPMEFKVLVGRTNLAANGFEVPDDVTGMVVNGVAIGDFMLSCVEGHINSITFLFNDGTIQTVSKRSAAGSNINSNTHATRIGYITDERGAPCINGQKITNAPAYLTGVVGLKTLEVAARAAAQSQTTTVANGLGSMSAVTGDQNKYVMNQAAAAGVDEVSNWLMKRMNDSFDAVYVAPGLNVSVHLNEPISLDKDDSARRLHYGKANTTGYSDHARNSQLD